MTSHRHTPPGTHEYDEEPQVGLPERLPDNETLIWQGSPNWRSMAMEVFHVRKIAMYFLGIFVLRGLFVGEELGWQAGLVSAMFLLPLFAFALATLAIIAYLSARDTLYTITNKRVVMRVGIALTLTYNIPLKLIGAAGIHVRKDRSGDLPLTLANGNKIAFINLWPHTRPWKIASPQPMLRCIPEVEQVAAQLAIVWSAANQQIAVPLKQTRDVSSSVSNGRLENSSLAAQ
jgi:Bacterial PH domain